MEEVDEIVAEVFEIDVHKVTDDLGPDDVEKWDSMGQLALIGAIEAKFRITFEIEEIFEIFTIGDIKKILTKKGVK
jgi:acyl carrier protein